MNTVTVVLSIFALGVAGLALHRNAVLSNEVGKCKMVEIGPRHRLDKLEGGE